MKRRMMGAWTALTIICAGVQPARLYGANTAPNPADAWPVPGDVPEMMNACKDIPAMYSFSRNGYLSIECGYQAVLLGSKVPIGPAPHIPWAKPYARGKLKVLAFTTFGNAPSDAAQLAQVARELDCDMRFVLIADIPTVWDFAKDDAYYHGFLAPQAREALKEDYDVILLAMGTYHPPFGIAPIRTYFPDDVYQTILQKAQNGAGLVFVGSFMAGTFWVDKTPLTNAIPAKKSDSFWWPTNAVVKAAAGETLFAGMPLGDLDKFVYHGWQPKEGAKVLMTEGERPLVMAGTYGKGRTVLLGWDSTLTPITTRSQDLLKYVANSRQFEHGMAVTLQAITYAAQKEPPVQVLAQPAVLAAGKAGQVVITLNGAAQLECALRFGGEETLHQIAFSAKSGANAVPLPALPSGTYWLDVIARDRQGASLGWGSTPVTVTADRTLTVTTDTDVYRTGQTVRVTGTLSQPSPTLRATVTVRDAAGRVLATGPAARQGDVFTFVYPVVDARIAPHEAIMSVYEANAPVLRERAAFFVPNNRWDDYENMLWSNKTQIEMNPQMRDIGGFTAVMDGYGSEATSKAGAPYGIRACRMNDGCLDPALMQTDPVKAETAADPYLKTAIEAARKYGCVTWALQDERHAGEAGMPNEEGLNRFRAYLLAQYGTLEKLNASWGSQHTAWTNILPTLTKDLKPESRNVAPWLDFRLYVADQAFQVDKRHADMIRQVLGPDVSVGIDGFTSSGHVIPYGALDIGRLLTEGAFSSYCPYGDDLLVASMVQGPLMKYIGWGMPRKDYFGAPWRDAFRGHRGTFRFFGSTFYSEFGWLQPAGRWTGEGTRELREGVGKALMGAKRQLDPIAFLYSYPSMIVMGAEGHWVEPGNDHLLTRPANASRDAFERMLLSCGNSFGYLTEKQVQQGALQGRKLLIVPHCMGAAISDATCAAIKQFVADGGMVVADMAPAVMDEHGKPRTAGGLNELFGVTRDKLEFGERSTDYLVGTTGKDPQMPVNGTNLGEGGWYVGEWFEKNLKVTDGTALGQHWFINVPAMVVKHTGKGQTLLLNFLHTSTYRRNGEPEEDDLKLMEQILRVAGVPPQAVTQTPYGKQERYCEINTLKDGAIDYVGVYAQKMPTEDPATMQIVFPTPRETYDVRSGTYLGKVREAPLPLRLQDAALFARLDYRITGIKVTAKSAARGQAVPVSVALATTGKPERQVVHLEVIAPDGTRSFFHTRNVKLREGTYAGAIQTALNDQRGKWTINARDVISGTTAKTTFKLR